MNGSEIHEFFDEVERTYLSMELIIQIKVVIPYIRFGFLTVFQSWLS